MQEYFTLERDFVLLVAQMKENWEVGVRGRQLEFVLSAVASLLLILALFPFASVVFSWAAWDCRLTCK